MSPSKRYAKKQAKARQRRRLPAPYPLGPHLSRRPLTCLVLCPLPEASFKTIFLLQNYFL